MSDTAKHRQGIVSRSSSKMPPSNKLSVRPKKDEANARRRPDTKPQEPAIHAAQAKKPAFYEAVALYESAVRALQRHEYASAAETFRAVIERYPDERELLERARLYLRVCERATAERPAPPQTPAERVYAATLALNAGDQEGAIGHLRRALDENPDDDHAHYMLAVALTRGAEPEKAIDHLRRSIELNPQNRPLARQDSDLDPIRHLDSFDLALEAPESARKKAPSRR
jgi:tetratricopeptide (TPR) repeat protein